MADCVLTLDIGSSSARTMVFGLDGQLIHDCGSTEKYRAKTTSDGGWEIDPEELFALCRRLFDETVTELRQQKLRPVAVGFDTFWQHIFGLNSEGKPTTALIHVFDTRSAPQAATLKARLDENAMHGRTGAVFHPSYTPPKLLWLSETKKDAFAATKSWVTFGEFFFLRLFGKAVSSISMVSGSGLWDQRKNLYDQEMLSILPVRAEQFCAVEEMDQPQQKLLPPFASEWPELDGIPWFPALGDGACDNVGSGCTNAERYGLMIGTSGAMRVVLTQQPDPLPFGLFCYRVDRRRFLVGGALSNGGEVFAWCKRTFNLPEDQELERQIAALPPGGHELTVVPLFAGERSTKWSPEAKGAVTGMEFTTTSVEIVRAALEGVALRFREVYELMCSSTPNPQAVIASGGGILSSPSWTQMIADALHRPLRICREPEATARGAALLALERIGAISSIDAARPLLGDMVEPTLANHAIYTELLRKQRAFYTKLFEEKW